MLIVSCYINVHVYATFYFRVTENMQQLALERKGGPMLYELTEVGRRQCVLCLCPGAVLVFVIKKNIKKNTFIDSLTWL